MLKTLQVGRGLAALAVLAFHLSLGMGLPRYGGRMVFHAFTSRGDLGVDFFFVLSGFIILFAHEGDIGRPAAWGRYVYRRVVRVYPIYWLYSAMLVAAVVAGLTVDKGLPPTPAVWLSDVTLVRFSGGTPLLGQAWTLFHEVAFYAAFSVLVVNRRAGLVLMGAWAVLCLATYHLDREGRHGAWIDYTAAYTLYFGFGMAAYLAFRRGWIRLWGVALGVALIAGALVAEGLGFAYALLPLGLGFSFLIAGAATAERDRNLRPPSFLLLLGDASYSVYLVHEEVMFLCLKVLTFLRAERWLGGEGIYIVTFLATAAIGVGAYLLLEKPIVGFLQSRSGASSVTVKVS